MAKCTQRSSRGPQFRNWGLCVTSGRTKGQGDLLAVCKAEASEDGLSGGLRPSPLVLIEKADRAAELQAQLLDSLGAV